MVRFFQYHFLQSPRRVCAVILAFALLFGVCFGGICSDFADPDLFLLMRTAAQSRVSIVCLLPVLLLPVVISAFAVSIGLYWLLIPVAFLKSFFFGFLFCGVMIRYPNSGLLFALLFLSTDYLSLPILCWCWYRCIRSEEAGLRALTTSAFLLFGISFFNYQFISPFLASLLS